MSTGMQHWSRQSISTTCAWHYLCMALGTFFDSVLSPPSSILSSCSVCTPPPWCAASAGFILRDQYGQLLYAGSSKFQSQWVPLAELRAARAGLMVAYFLLQRIATWVEGESRIVYPIDQQSKTESFYLCWLHESYHADTLWTSLSTSVAFGMFTVTAQDLSI